MNIWSRLKRTFFPHSFEDAVEYGVIDRVRYLLGRGTNPNQSEFCIPLERAALNGHCEMVALLLEYGADPNRQIGGCGTALHGAALPLWSPSQFRAMGEFAMFGTMREDTRRQLSMSESPDSREPINVMVTQTLVENGANANARNNKGETPLKIAANWAMNHVAEVLLIAGADPDISDEQESTPLHEAAQWLNGELITALVDAGANTDVRNGNGETAADILKRRARENKISKQHLEHLLSLL